MEVIKNRFLKFIKKNQLIKNEDKIVVGLSGGPDSICLLKLLCSIQDEYKLSIAAAHINHMLRGEDADGDEAYCKEICNELGVEFFCKRIDVNIYSKERGLSSETAGREVRYNFFNEVMNGLKYNKIATAHNANDQAETILMRIMRGTGLEGLGGIPVVRENKYIRPILFMKREEIEKFCSENQLNPRIDNTNMERMYNRNKVRLDILPYMKENFNPDIIESINRMAMLLQADNLYIEEQVENIYKNKCEILKDRVIIKKEIFDESRAIWSRVIRKSISEVSGCVYDVEMKHIQDVYELTELGTNKQINLPKDIIVSNIYGDIQIKKKYKEKKELENKELVFNKEEILDKEIIFGNYTVSFQLLDCEKNIKFNENNFIKYFDFDKINGNIIMRYRKNGDKIIPLGMSGSKKLKDIFIDMKIPTEERMEIPIVQFDNGIAWIVGLRVSNIFKITKGTKRILKVSFERKGK